MASHTLKVYPMLKVALATLFRKVRLITYVAGRNRGASVPRAAYILDGSSQTISIATLTFYFVGKFVSLFNTKPNNSWHHKFAPRMPRTLVLGRNRCLSF